MGHHHHHSNKNLGITILLNVIITVAQAIGGFISGSVVLLSDAVHNFSDVLSLLISYFANRLSNKNANVKQTFGYRRSQIIAAFFNSATLIVLSFYIMYEALSHFLDKATVNADWVIYLALLSIAVNGLSVLFIKNDAKDNINMRSAYLHLFSDMLTSIAVLIGGFAMKYLQWFWVDSLFSFFIAIYLLYLSWDIFLQSIKILMHYTPEGIDITKIAEEVSKIEGVKNIHHIHVWQLDDHEIMFESHVDLEHNIPVSNFDDINQQIKKVLLTHNIAHATLQPEFGVDDNKGIIHQHPHKH